VIKREGAPGALSGRILLLPDSTPVKGVRVRLAGQKVGAISNGVGSVRMQMIGPLPSDTVLLVYQGYGTGRAALPPDTTRGITFVA
jgi:hypothetical protein